MDKFLLKSHVIDGELHILSQSFFLHIVIWKETTMSWFISIKISIISSCLALKIIYSCIKIMKALSNNHNLRVTNSKTLNSLSKSKIFIKRKLVTWEHCVRWTNYMQPQHQGKVYFCTLESYFKLYADHLI